MTIRKMTDQEKRDHLAQMLKGLSLNEIMEFQAGIRNELDRRAIKETEDLLEGKFVFVDAEALKIRQ